MTGFPSTPGGSQPGDGFADAGRPPSPPQPQAAPRPSRRKGWLTHGLTAVVALAIGVAVGGGGTSNGDDDSAQAPATSPAVVQSAAAPTSPASAPSAGARETATTSPPAAPSATTAADAGARPPAAPAPAGPATSVDGDGQYLVGDDMEAGTYKTAGPADSVIPNCYWARLKDASGEFGAIIANGIGQGQTRVTVRKGEYFETRGCQKWEKVG